MRAGLRHLRPGRPGSGGAATPPDHYNHGRGADGLMYNLHKMQGEVRLVNPHSPVVCEPEPCSVGTALMRGRPELPPSDHYALTIADEAIRWLVLATSRSPA